MANEAVTRGREGRVCSRRCPEAQAQARVTRHLAKREYPIGGQYCCPLFLVKVSPRWSTIACFGKRKALVPCAKARVAAEMRRRPAALIAFLGYASVMSGPHLLLLDTFFEGPRSYPPYERECGEWSLKCTVRATLCAAF